MADDFLRLIAQIIIALLTIFTVYFASKDGWRSKTKAKRRTTTFSFVFGILLGLGSCCLSYLDYKKELADSDASRLAEVQRRKEYAKVIGNQKLTIDTANRIIELQKQLNEKSDLVNDLQLKTLGNVTGGDQAPILKLFTSKALYAGKPKSKYYIVNFDLVNKGKYPLHGVKGSVFDSNIPSTLKIGVKHDRGDEGTSFEQGNKVMSYLTAYNNTFLKSIGGLTKGNSYIFHTSTICPSTSDDKTFMYVVKINWDQGEVSCYFALEESINQLRLKSADVVLNGKSLTDYKRFIQYSSEK